MRVRVVVLQAAPVDGKECVAGTHACPLRGRAGRDGCDGGAPMRIAHAEACGRIFASLEPKRQGLD